MNTGEELAISAMKKDFKRLSKIAEKAEKECDEYMSIGTEMVDIHNEFVEIVKSGEHSASTLKKLDALKARKDKANKIMQKDLIKLIDKQSEAEINRDSLGDEIQMMEFRHGARSRKAS